MVNIKSVATRIVQFLAAFAVIGVVMAIANLFGFSEFNEGVLCGVVGMLYWDWIDFINKRTDDKRAD